MLVFLFVFFYKLHKFTTCKIVFILFYNNLISAFSNLQPRMPPKRTFEKNDQDSERIPKKKVKYSAKVGPGEQPVSAMTDEKPVIPDESEGKDDKVDQSMLYFSKLFTIFTCLK